MIMNIRNFMKNNWIICIAILFFLIGCSGKTDNFKLGEESLKDERYEDAINYFTKHIEENPKDYKSYKDRGRAFHRADLYDEAVADFTKAIELEPIEAEPYIDRGMTYSRLRKFKKAFSDLDKSIELEPDNEHAYFTKALAYRDLGLFSFMIISGKNQGCKYDQDFIKNTVGEMPYNDYKSYYMKAIADCSKSIELNPNNEHSFFMRGLSYYELEDYKNALPDLSKSLELNPEDEMAYFYKAKSCEELNLVDEELDIWRAFLKLADKIGEKSLEYLRPEYHGRSPVAYAKERIKILEGQID